MTGLFDLPSELLFQIIHLALSSRPPVSSNGSRHRPDWGYSGRNVIYLCSPGIIPTPNALNLLLASQRLYSETILYLSKKPQIFKLDVAIVNNNWIWPTWRTIPIRSRSGIIDQVDIELILCCTGDERHLQTEWRNQNGQNMTDCTSKELISLLRHFILLEKPPITRINTIRVNIDTARYGNGNATISEEEVSLRTMHGFAHLCFDTLYPIDAVNSEDFHAALYMLTRPMLDDWCMPFAELAPQRIGHVSFCVDGDEFVSFDVAKQVRPNASLNLLG
ncbi:Nn.00g052890.m01.CDS01 [Neocucurbitaria sp. VM-36]